MISRRCPSCHRLHQEVVCPVCKKRYALANAKKRQAEDEARKLYGSTLWKKCRTNIRMKYHDLDIWLLAIGEIYTCTKPYIHHIIEKEIDPSLIFMESNLIPVCKESHEEIHRLYKTDKRAALDRIQRGIETFREMFCDD